MIGQRIRSLRQAKNWTQDELAAHSGLSKSYLSLIETGQRTPSIATLGVLSTVFGVDSDELLAQGDLDSLNARMRLAFELLSEEDRESVVKHAEALARVAEIGRLMR